jgi:hypothetical protein
MSPEELARFVDSSQFQLTVQAAYENGWRYDPAKRVSLAIAQAFKLIGEHVEESHSVTGG